MKCFICQTKLPHKRNKSYEANKSLVRAVDIKDNKKKWAHGCCAERKLQDYEDIHKINIRIQRAAGLLPPEKT